MNHAIRKAIIGMQVPDNWSLGVDHDPRSQRLIEVVGDIDFHHFGDSICIKTGGDGDNGETLMFILDEVFRRPELFAYVFGSDPTPEASGHDEG